MIKLSANQNKVSFTSRKAGIDKQNSGEKTDRAPAVFSKCKAGIGCICLMIGLLLCSSVVSTSVQASEGEKITPPDALRPMHVFIYRDSDDLLASGSMLDKARSNKVSHPRGNSGTGTISSEKKKNNSTSRPSTRVLTEPTKGTGAVVLEKLEKPNWQSFDDSVFARAEKEDKLVLLDLEAVWCHWCHVMDKETYANAKVLELLDSNFIVVKVDQDARPDLSHKYEDYGWPATIIFDKSGREIAKRSGYIRPEKMIRLLTKVINDPSPEDGPPAKVAYSEDGLLSSSLKSKLMQRYINGYDAKYGAWGRFHKFLDWDSVELAMELGLAGDKESESRARQTLTSQLNLVDPVWGGVYQYSTDGDWQHPHFEKIMQVQAENMRIYSLGYMLYGEKKFLNAACGIASYLKTFLQSDDGAFYTSQDADLKPGQHSAGYFELSDKARRARGIPRIDKHIYARENGWAINGLVHLYMATAEKSYLDRAIKATSWIEENRGLGSGGFSHDKQDQAGPFLGDTLAMGRAYLSLYEATADRSWLTKSCKCADFIESKFHSEVKGEAGYLTASRAGRRVAEPEPLPDENVVLTRFANLLYHYCGDKRYKNMATKAMRYLATEAIALRRKVLVAGPILSDREISREPVHITIVGRKTDGDALALYKAALGSRCLYRRIDWYDSSEGPLPNSEVEYPVMKRAAAFSCGNGICSSPVFEPEKIKQFFKIK